MPTARELLEQADALMRRNRVDLADDIPVLTDAVPSLAEAPRGVAATVPATSADARSGGPSAPPEATHASTHEGEPSDWLEIDTAEPSVIGDAPDSVAIVPQVELRRAVDEELLQSAEHEEIELTSAEDDRFAPEPMSAVPTPPVAVEPAGRWSDADAALPAGEPGAEDPAAEPFSANAQVEIVEVTEFAEIARVDEAFARTAAPTAPVGVGALEIESTPPEPAYVPPAIPSAALLAASFAAAKPVASADPVSFGPDTRWPAMTEPVHEAVPSPDDTPADAVPAARPLGPDDQAHWDSVAEEIRMQVLQRIDLFTDTGLREQLGERLKPIVDRASADLVATINQHVGELLRAYVAEAIEREIERWRQDN